MIHKSVLLPCDLAHAFQLFTAEISVWWPAERRHTGDPQSEIIMLASGPFYERSRDERRMELGRMREWDPPHHLLFDFYPGTDADHPTEVTVTFTAEEGGTRLTIQHGPTPASADLFDLRAPRYQTSWELVAQAMALACKS
jgi:uncharacterized protein YndB with AHSA1/START domain